MTQGEEHRHGAASTEFRRNLELSHRSDPAGTAICKPPGITHHSHSIANVLLPPTNRSTSHQSHGGDDARTLLQFVHHASCDIKAALDQGSYAHKNHTPRSPTAIPIESNVASDNVIRTDPTPIRRISPEGMLSQHYKRHLHHPHHSLSHHPNKLGDEREDAFKDVENDTRGSRETFTRRFDLPLSLPKQERESHRHVDHIPKGVDLSCKEGINVGRKTPNEIQSKSETINGDKNEPRNLDLFRYVDMLRENSLKSTGISEDDREQSEEESNNESDVTASRENSEEKKETSARENGANKSEKISSVPLRKRRLPASFWQEPKGKSDHHRTMTRPGDRPLDGQPRSFVHHPGLSLFGQLKLPIPNPLSPSHFDFDFGLGRHLGAEKTPFLYPSTSSATPFLNLPYRSHLPLPVHHHGVEERGRHGLAAVPCTSNVCMCHLHNLAGCSSNVCEPSSQNASALLGRNIPIPPISPLDTTTPPSLALGRWGAMQSADGMGDLLGGYPLPRILKPIPTKSLTSYPPRFHPIFTWTLLNGKNVKTKLCKVSLIFHLQFTFCHVCLGNFWRWNLWDVPFQFPVHWLSPCILNMIGSATVRICQHFVIILS